MGAASFIITVWSNPDFWNINGMEENTVTWLFGAVLVAMTSKYVQLEDNT